jgi:hypothetical protein
MNELITSVLRFDDVRDQERHRLAASPRCRFVEVNEFVQLATSWRKMERRNVSSCDVLGLYDLNTHEWFLIEEEKVDEILGE